MGAWLRPRSHCHLRAEFLGLYSQDARHRPRFARALRDAAHTYGDKFGIDGIDPPPPCLAQHFKADCTPFHLLLPSTDFRFLVSPGARRQLRARSCKHEKTWTNCAAAFSLGGEFQCLSSPQKIAKAVYIAARCGCTIEEREIAANLYAAFRGFWRLPEAPVKASWGSTDLSRLLENLRASNYETLQYADIEKLQSTHFEFVPIHGQTYEYTSHF
jgi:hypothetical protein